jgi:hypothetical protein
MAVVWDRGRERTGARRRREGQITRPRGADGRGDHRRTVRSEIRTILLRWIAKGACRYPLQARHSGGGSMMSGSTRLLPRQGLRSMAADVTTSTGIEVEGSLSCR